MARPTTIDIEDLVEKFSQYVEENDEPFVQEFTAKFYDIGKTRFYELLGQDERLANAHKKALDKQEMYILKNAPTGKYNPVFGIFRLKQPCFGYVDRTEQQVNVEVNVISAEDRQQRIADLLSKRDAIEAEYKLIEGSD